MIGNVFDTSSGTCVAFGKPGNPQVLFYLDQGPDQYFFVEGTVNGNVYPNYLKYDGGQVVPDVDRVATYEAREQAKQDRRAAAMQAFVDYRDFDASQITDPETRQLFNFVRTKTLAMFRYVASQIDQ